MKQEEKGRMEFWLFRLNDPALCQFYQKQAKNQSLYYIIIIEEVTRDFSTEAKELFHLYPNTALLVKNYLMPVFYSCGLRGLCIVISEKFAQIEHNIAMLKFYSFSSEPEGIVDFKTLSEEQRQCLNLLEMEFAHPYDDKQPVVLRNLMINLLALSSTDNHNEKLKEGHLLTYALQGINLIETYVFHEKRMTFYADRMGITAQTLTQAFEFAYKKSFKEILSNYIIIHALQMLVFSSKSITQIARELDFDTSYFIRFFTKKKGLNPKILRERYREIINEL